MTFILLFSNLTLSSVISTRMSVYLSVSAPVSLFQYAQTEKAFLPSRPTLSDLLT